MGMSSVLSAQVFFAQMRDHVRWLSYSQKGNASAVGVEAKVTVIRYDEHRNPPGQRVALLRTGSRVVHSADVATIVSNARPRAEEATETRVGVGNER